MPGPADALKDLEATLHFCRTANKAVEDLDFVLEQPASVIGRLLTHRIRVLTQRGQHTAAAQTADKMAELAPQSASRLYDAACGYSLCIEAVALNKKPEELTDQDRDLQEKYAQRAVALLRQAVEGGFKNAAHMRADKDLDPLRKREDFKELLEKIEKKE